MTNFKIGQKVVYIGYSINPNFREPPINDILTISAFCDVFKGSVRVYEYPFGNNGEIQSFHPTTIRCLDNKFADDLIEYISNIETENTDYYDNGTD